MMGLLFDVLHRISVLTATHAESQVSDADYNTCCQHTQPTSYCRRFFSSDIWADALVVFATCFTVGLLLGTITLLITVDNKDEAEFKKQLGVVVLPVNPIAGGPLNRGVNFTITALHSDANATENSLLWHLVGGILVALAFYLWSRERCWMTGKVKNIKLDTMACFIV